MNPSSSAKPGFSTALVITTYNKPSELEVTLESVSNQSVLPERIYIADDGSGPQTSAVIEGFKGHLSIEHIWHEDLGFRRSKILNKVIETAAEDYLIFIDGDEILNPHFLKDHKSMAELNCVILGSRCNVSLPEERRSGGCPSLAGLAIHFAKGRITNDVRTEKTTFKTRCIGFIKGFRLPFGIKRPCSERKARGGNMAAWRSDLLEVNGFDGAFHGWGFEDLDLVLRLQKNGVRSKQVLFNAICFHLDHPCSPPNDANRNLAYSDRPARCMDGIDLLIRVNDEI